MGVKDEQIQDLQKKVTTLEADADKREQYTRHPNPRFHGIPEVDGEMFTHIGVDHME